MLLIECWRPWIITKKKAALFVLWPIAITYFRNLLPKEQSSTCTFFGASVTTVCLFFFVIGRVLTRLD